MSNEDLGRYLRRRRVPDQLRDQLINLAEGSWLHARLLADITTRDTREFVPLPLTPDDLYAAELRRVADLVGEGQLRPVLAVLAASPIGPVLPLSLLANASGRLGGPDNPARVRDVLVALAGLAVRSQPGTESEQVGLFHENLSDYVKRNWRVTFSDVVTVKEGHSTLVEAIEDLAPAHPPCSDAILRNYAARYHGEHLWALGQYADILAVFDQRQMRRPADNRDMWQRYLRRAETEKALGPCHPVTLRVARALGRWTGLAGDYAEAVHLLHAVRRKCEDVGNRTETLATERELAHWVGMLEGPRKALEGYGAPEGRALESYWNRYVAPVEAGEPLEVWREIAHWIGELGRPADAVEMLDERFLAKMDEVFGSNHPDTFAARQELGRWTAEAGAVGDGLEQLKRLL